MKPDNERPGLAKNAATRQALVVGIARRLDRLCKCGHALKLHDDQAVCRALVDGHKSCQCMQFQTDWALGDGRRKGKTPLRAPGFALLVIGLDGEEAYLCNGMGDTPTRFFSKREAQSQKDFMWIGMEGDVQSINIVPYPKLQEVPK